MKNIFFFLLLIPTSLFSQSGSETTTQPSQQSSYTEVKPIDIGKCAVQGSLIRMAISVVVVKNMTNSTKTDSIYINWPGQNTHVSLTIDGNDADTLISVATKMFEKTYSTPKENSVTSYKCANGFEYKASWDGKNWSTSMDNYKTGAASIKIDTGDIPAFIKLLKEARGKFEK